MRPALLNPLFAPVTSLPGVGPKQDKLLRYLLGRDETPRLVDLLLHLPSQRDRPPRAAENPRRRARNRGDAGGDGRPPPAASAAQFAARRISSMPATTPATWC